MDDILSSSKAHEVSKCGGLRPESFEDGFGLLSIPVGVTTFELSQPEEPDTMKKKDTIVRYTLEEIEELQRRGLTETDWERLDNMTEEEVERNALEDNRRHGIPDAWYKDAVLMKWPPKEQISIRIDEDVLKFFRGMGKGYQTRINAVLRAFMEARS